MLRIVRQKEKLCKRYWEVSSGVGVGDRGGTIRIWSWNRKKIYSKCKTVMDTNERITEERDQDTTGYTLVDR